MLFSQIRNLQKSKFKTRNSFHVVSMLFNATGSISREIYEPRNIDRDPQGKEQWTKPT